MRRSGAEEDHAAGKTSGEGGWPARVSVWARAETMQALDAIARWARTQWSIEYERPELLRLVTQITLQLIDLGLVQRRGLHFILDVPPTQIPDLDATNEGQRGHRLWVGGPTTDGLGWLEGWMRQQKVQPTHGDVLELAVDLALQAVFAGLVPAPRGPHVVVTAPKQQ